MSPALQREVGRGRGVDLVGLEAGVAWHLDDTGGARAGAVTAVAEEPNVAAAAQKRVSGIHRTARPSSAGDWRPR